ncbi:alpha-1,2-fucosyltransferase, partial [Sphingobacterium thalpophilum]
LDENDLTRTVFIVCGYWQSYKYFLPIFSLLKKQYRLFYDIDTIYIPIQQAINDSESVMVHVRRGDYLYRGNFEKHGVVDVNYIETGMNYYREVLSDPLFFIFSDDIEWCAVNIKMSMDVIFVKKDHDEGRSSFCLMRQCKYFLISNSTYSWWAAWLSNYSKKQVICPRRWFRTEDIDSSDLIPSDWKLL